jgi:hypothetical protein
MKEVLPLRDKLVELKRGRPVLLLTRELAIPDIGDNSNKLQYTHKKGKAIPVTSREGP